jgi:hypothetical protein
LFSRSRAEGTPNKQKTINQSINQSINRIQPLLVLSLEDETTSGLD